MRKTSVLAVVAAVGMMAGNHSWIDNKMEVADVTPRIEDRTVENVGNVNVYVRAIVDDGKGDGWEEKDGVWYYKEKVKPGGRTSRLEGKGKMYVETVQAEPEKARKEAWGE